MEHEEYCKDCLYRDEDFCEYHGQFLDMIIEDARDCDNKKTVNS